MAIENVGGVGAGLPKPTSLSTPGLAQGAKATASDGSPALPASSSSSASATASILFDSRSAPTSNVALAMWILSMLLADSEKDDSNSDSFLLGLAAGLLVAAENKGPSFFFSSTSNSSSSQNIVGSDRVNAAYNTELPNVTANATSPTDQAGQSPTKQVPGIDTSG